MTLRSVMLLIRLLGAELKSFLPLVMVLLMSALSPLSPAAPKLQSLEGWSALVHVLAAEEPAELANIANQVCVTAMTHECCFAAWAAQHHAHSYAVYLNAVLIRVCSIVCLQAAHSSHIPEAICNCKAK